ncbi:AGC/NDR protein kinase [Fimicolochytrium jonesii]|uniref:AGC/NDR protein kinase n=1 Tax=Fimicolochytrium jonesii TaxID=1396493 RepID=UPI0022FEEBA7|nr:AGC/NDR protein kinase [Fimicolochytrium jonesii]KAI8816744.1 AGC/NDR protein kinase [Fimicolochytrium jonesii]
MTDVGAQGGKKDKRRVSKDMISTPKGFDHCLHASSASEAESVLQKMNSTRNTLPRGPLKDDPESKDPTSMPSPVPEDRLRSFKALIQPWQKKVAPSPTTADYGAGVEGGSTAQRPSSSRGSRSASVPSPGVSRATVERSVAAKIYFEQYFDRLYKSGPTARAKRRHQLESELAQMTLTETEKRSVRQEWLSRESERMRRTREKVTVNDFDVLKTLGNGAFGLVRLVRHKDSKEVFAMKILKKSEMIKRGQESHVRAERDLLSDAAAESAEWVVPLVCTFQDTDNLYFVMEYMPGGDLLSLLIKLDVFNEEFAKHYVAEMILAIEEVHKLGVIHRDIKPDNFLFDASGHIKITDFGLATDFHWSHDSSYYDEQRRATMQRALSGNDGSPTSDDLGNASTEVLGSPDSPPLQSVIDYTPPHTKILQWRDQNRKQQAYSVVGTNNYMAPEILLGTGYDKACDWWSLGVIVFEMLYGFPPFCSKNRQQTKLKIVNWRKCLRFPAHPSVSREAQDFIMKLVCDKDTRLGSGTPAGNPAAPGSLSSHPSAASGISVFGNIHGTSATNQGGNNPRSSVVSSVTTMTPGASVESETAEIKRHPWFRTIDWSELSTIIPPFVPKLAGDTDTTYFENVEPPEDPASREEVEQQGPPPAVGGDACAANGADAEDADMLDMRKRLAFAGFTYKAPRREKSDGRAGVGHHSFSSGIGE